MRRVCLLYISGIRTTTEATRIEPTGSSRYTYGYPYVLMVGRLVKPSDPVTVIGHIEVG